LGEVLCCRNKYRCLHCGEDFYFFDESLEIGRSKVSKRFAKISSLSSVSGSFSHARKIIEATLNINVSETLLETIVNNIGSKLYNDAVEKSRHPESVSSKDEHIGELYIQPDGAMVPIKSVNKVEYKENKLGIIFKGDDIEHKKTKKGKERTEIKNKHFVSSIAEGAEKFKKMLYATAKENGLYKADKVILLCDGAPWLSKMKAEYFPNAVQILDWYHAVEHLWQTAHLLFGDSNNEKCKEWVEPLKGLLWSGKVEEVIGFLEEYGKGLKNQTPIWQLRGYFTSNKDNMHYDEYREAGYYIGSGAIESANKYIVANRLKQAGMRWNAENANSMIWLRCKYFESDWDDFWESMNLAVWLKPQKSMRERAA
jgi:hypothetical protein